MFTLHARALVLAVGLSAAVAAQQAPAPTTAIPLVPATMEASPGRAPYTPTCMEWLLVEMTVKHGGLIYSSDGVKISFRPDRNDTRLVVEIETVDGYDKIAQRRCIDAFRADIQMRSAMWPWLTHEVHAVRAMATLASPPAATNQSVSGQQPPPPTGPVLPPLRRTGATKPAKAKPEKNTLKE